MAGNKYGYAHREVRKVWAPIVASGSATCAEEVCLMSSRWIPPGSEWHLAHDPSGTRYVGVSHPACNISEASIRMHATRKMMRANNWIL